MADLTRDDVLSFINDVIIENQGELSDEDTVIRESGIDSFGYAMFFLDLDDEYDCFPNEYLDDFTPEEANKMTIKHVIDRVMSCS